MLYKAMQMALPGDVIVYDAQGESAYAITGEIMVTWCRWKGLGGLIINGCIRDSDALRRMDFPVFATGVSPNGPLKHGPGEINFPVCIAGQVISPGDIIVGDSDGFVAIDPADAPFVLEKALAQKAKEEALLKDISRLDMSWIDRTLEEKGCTYID